MTDFTAKVKAFILRHRMLSDGDRVLVTVSGGPDSVALLRVLFDLADEFALRLEVAHLEHGIRGAEAREDGEFVRDLAAAMGLPCHSKKIDLPRMRSEAGKGNLEALARRERQRFFGAVARQHGLTKVAVAHTQDDQAETVLMWLLRGCGRKGLGGMSPMHCLHAENDLMLIRPLLGVSKAEVFEYLKAKNLRYRWDRSNEDTSLLRNWLRLRLIPQLKERIDSQLPSRLGQHAGLIRSEQLLLESLAAGELQRIRTPQGLDRQGFLEREEAMQRLMLRSWIEEIRGHLRGIDFDHIEESLHLIKLERPQSRFSLPGGWELVREYESIRLEGSSRNRRRLCYSYRLECGVDLNIREAGVVIRSARVSPPLTQWPGSLMEAVFDGARLPGKMSVRNFRHGDLFQPLGMTGHKKVKDLFIDKKVPLSVRSTLPLLSIGREILWIPGYGRSEIGKVGPQTREILRFTAVPVRVK